MRHHVPPSARFGLLAVTCLAATVLTGCGGDEEKSATAADAPPAEPAAAAVWVTAADAEKAYRIDPETDEVTATVETGYYPSDIAYGFDSIWIAGNDGMVRRIARGEDTATEIEAEGVNGLVVGDDAVWLARQAPGELLPLDPDTEELGTAIPLEDEDAYAENLAWDDGVIHADNGYDASSLRIDTGSGEVTTAENEDVITDVLVDGDQVLEASFTSLGIRSADDVTEVDRLDTDVRPWSLYQGGPDDTVWVGYEDGSIGTFADGALAEPTAVEGGTTYPSSLTYADDSLWVAYEGGTVLRLDLDDLSVQQTIELPGAAGVADLAVEPEPSE